MPLLTAILFTVALLAAVLAAVGWSMDPAASAFGDWFIAKATEGGLWSGLFLFLLVVGYFIVRGNRADKGTEKPN